MIKVGCCGFQKSREKYFQTFKLVELQETFYDLPTEERIKKLREEAPEDFEFTVKCFQGITHPSTSPTWRRSKIKSNENYGDLKDTKEVLDAWNKMLKICKTLKAKICLIQLPASFKDDEKNIKNAFNFFSKIDRNNLEIAIELRGWSKENIRMLCEKFNLIHSVDPFASTPVIQSKIAYFRLHGSPPGKRMYNYKYTRDDLLRLYEMIKKINASEIYVLFNNIFMFEDAIEFMNIIKQNS